jgi:superfamily II DNA/RNA helicase
VQRFAQFNEKGQSMAKEWQSIIDDATKRIGGVNDSRCRVTVTDKFGGRGHDFQVVDKEANANGGMLVIATSIPDEREWIQWKGRTARQDRPGQFYVILAQDNKVFTNNKELLNKVKKAKHESGDLKGQPDHDARIEVLLDAADEGIGSKLKEYGGEQATGEKLNAVSEAHFKRDPRSFDDPWPNGSESDRALRGFLMSNHDAPPDVIVERARERLAIDLR